MSDTISGLNSSYLNGTYTNSTTSALESTLNNKDLSTSSSDELMEVCKDFEEYFAEQMVKSMLKMAKVDSSDDDNSYASIFGLSSDSSDSGMSTMSSYFGDQMVSKLSEVPLCSDMTDIAKGLAGLGALFYVALRVWQSLSRAEPIDVFPPSFEPSYRPL